MATYLKCHSCKGFVPLSSEVTPMKFKWKDSKKMVKVHVCDECWNRARSLKVK